MRLNVLAVLCVVFAVPCLADDALNPHHVIDANGQPDMNKCGVCHTDTFDLARPKAETCTLCHSETVHGGSYEHIHAAPEAVSRSLASETEEAGTLPLTEAGGIYCGTCHLFHDPRLSADKPLASGWIPPRSGVAEAVRSSLEETVEALARRRDATQPVAEFASDGTTALRMSVREGHLCLHCHGSYAP